MLSNINMPKLDLWTLTVPELKTLLKVKSMDTKGNKEDLVRRLQENVPEYATTLQYEDDAVYDLSGGQIDISPHDSISQHGSHGTSGSRSSTSSARAKAAAKRAALEAKASFFEQQQALFEQQQAIKRERLKRELDSKQREAEEEEEELRLRQEMDRVELQAEISAAAAEEETLSRLSLTKSHSKVSATSPKVAFSSTPLHADGRYVPRPDIASGGESKIYRSDLVGSRSHLDPHAAEWQPRTKSSDDQAVLTRLVQKQQEQIQQQSEHINHCMNAIQDLKRESSVPQHSCTFMYPDVLNLPKTTLMQFDGNPLDFRVFMNAFDNTVGSLNVSDSAKLNRLLEYCVGKAVKVIKPCALMSPSDGYARARELLYERFGNEY